MGSSTIGLAAVPGTDLAPYLPRVAVEWLRTSPSARRRRLDGTMAFVDVSGFTAMSERLASKGKLGAEEVTDVMSATFTRLLAVAYEYGGGLVKFGGDALLLFFEGDRHAEAACCAAHGMRATLDELGPLPTSVGPVELKMHAGLHSDTFDFFLVGTSHRELIVAGRAAVRTVEMEEVAVAGEIALSDSTAALVAAEHHGERRGEGTLLASPPALVPTGIMPLPDTAGLDLGSCIPVSLREHLNAQRVESEHRHGAVAFVRFTALAPLLDDGSAADDAVEEAVAALQEAADAHGVCFLESDIDSEGGRVVLVAGVPTTAGDDEERLLRTVRAAVDARTRLPLHVGVANGDLFAGRFGPPFRRTFTILGGTAALAARLMARAPERTIWTTRDVLERSNTTFETTALEPLNLKGKSRPVEAVALGAIGSARVRAVAKLPLVDRQRELPVLEASLIPVKMGFGSFVELVGPAGIGKSRVLEEVCDRSGGLPVVATACEQYEATTPYFAFRRLLETELHLNLDGSAEANSDRLTSKLEHVAPKVLDWLPLLGDVLDVPVGSTRQVDELQPSFRRARLNGVVEELLANLFDSPTLLLFEDTHWMDEASSDLLRHLGTHVQSKPWLICATRRAGASGFVAAEGTPPIPALTLVLDPIPEEDARKLAQAAAEDAGVPPADVDVIVERAGGNPLFVRELVAATALEPGQTETLPDNVEGVVAARIDSLAPGDRALLRWASVLGATFSGEIVAHVLEGDPDAALDSESWDRLGEFVERDPYLAGWFRFRHALIRDAAYHGLSFRRRRELHHRVGEALEATSPDEAEALSLHFDLAEEREKTWQYSLVAARRAEAKHANVDAAEFYRRALDIAHHVPTVPRVDVGHAWRALGDVLALSGDYSEARLAYQRARTYLRHDPEEVAALALRQGRLRENEGRYDQAVRWYLRGLRSIESLGEKARSEHRLSLSLGYAAARFREGDVVECIEWVERVVNDARAANELASLAHAYYLLHLAFTSLGSPKRLDVRDLALPIYEELGDLLGQANTLNNLGIDAYYEGRWEDALALYGRSRDARVRIGDVIGAAMAANNIAEILSDQGRLDEAEEMFRDVYATCDKAGNRLLAAVGQANLGRASARGGAFKEARELLGEALTTLTDIRAGSFIVETKARLAELALLEGDAGSALATANDAVVSTEAAAPPNVLALIHRIRGCALAALGRPEDARAELEESLGVARESDTLYEAALTLLARARLEERSADESEARAILDALHVIRVAEPAI